VVAGLLRPGEATCQLQGEQFASVVEAGGSRACTRFRVGRRVARRFRLILQDRCRPDRERLLLHQGKSCSGLEIVESKQRSLEVGRWGCASWSVAGSNRGSRGRLRHARSYHLPSHASRRPSRVPMRADTASLRSGETRSAAPGRRSLALPGLEWVAEGHECSGPASEESRDSDVLLGAPAGGKCRPSPTGTGPRGRRPGPGQRSCRAPARAPWRGPSTLGCWARDGVNGVKDMQPTGNPEKPDIFALEREIG